ncbi:hypothetical protein Tco_0984863, partial [Tanacetum coccineum]
VMTPYYSEETVYSKSDLDMENEDGISIMDDELRTTTWKKPSKCEFHEDHGVNPNDIGVSTLAWFMSYQESFVTIGQRVLARHSSMSLILEEKMNHNKEYVYLSALQEHVDRW